jgi:hypothetical protein
MECPESPEDLKEKLLSMEFEWVRVAREQEEEWVKGILEREAENVWKIEGRNNSYAKFSLKHILSICPKHIHIRIKQLEPK